MTACQIPGGCPVHAPAVFLLTFQTAPITGRTPAPGLTFTQGLCRAHISPRSDQVRAEGGSIVAVDDAP